MSLDESSWGICLKESDFNNFEEKCNYQHGLEIELLSDDSYFDVWEWDLWELKELRLKKSWIVWGNEPTI